MASTDYAKAYKLGKKNYQYRLLHGQVPTLEVLDDIIPSKGTFSDCGNQDRGTEQCICGEFYANLKGDVRICDEMGET